MGGTSYEIATELMTAMTRLRARLRSESTPSEMRWTWSQLAALGRIVQDGPTTMTDLAQAEHVRRQSMAETVAVLRTDGLVRGEPDPTDGRKVLLVATDHGRDLLSGSAAAREAWLSIAMDSLLDSNEQQTLRQAAMIMSRLADTGAQATSRNGSRANPVRARAKRRPQDTPQ